MRIAITTEQDFVSSCFGCCQDCTIVEIEEGRICRTFMVPNAGWTHRTWADFLERNAVACLIVGKIGPNARAVLKWRGITVISGAQGSIDAVVEKYLSGALASSDNTCPEAACSPSPAERRPLKSAKERPDRSPRTV
jgi:predicted Fe-Mo cluster-binding NifX family protein